MSSGSQREKGKGEVAARISESFSESGDGEGLTGSAADKKLNWPESREFFIGDPCHVAEVRHAREPLREDSAREGIDLRKPRRLESVRDEREMIGADA